MAAAFRSADLGITLEVREGHGANIASWRHGLKDDKCAIFRAAA